MRTLIITLLASAALVSSGVFLSYYDQAIGSFRRNRKWGVFIVPFSLFFPYFYVDGKDSTRRKATTWFVITLILMILFIILVSYES